MLAVVALWLVLRPEPVPVPIMIRTVEDFPPGSVTALQLDALFFDATRLPNGKYGDLLVHEPAQAEVRITRTGDTLEICIDDFVSPTIIKRLNLDQSLFRTQISDWRAQINSVEIDTDYSGDVFTITHSDIPARKSDLVAGTYTVPAPQGPARVAMKITDMLGEEVLVTAGV